MHIAAIQENESAHAHLYGQTSRCYKVCNKLLDLNLFLPDSTQRGNGRRNQVTSCTPPFSTASMEVILLETFQKEIAAN
ncbi:MAG: hypothetical protein ACLR6J_07780 [Parabacteroides merdae]